MTFKGCFYTDFRTDKKEKETLQVPIMRSPIIATRLYELKSQSQPPLQCVFTDAFLSYANRSVHESTRQAPL